MRALSHAMVAIVVAAGGVLAPLAEPTAHPTASTAHSTVSVAQRSRVVARSDTSNWAGYIDHTPNTRDVSTRLRVPTVQTRYDGFASTWIGIDGDTSTYLAQAGVEENVIGHRPSYYAWWEVLTPWSTPPEQVISMPVRPGDLITLHVHRAPGAATMTVTNATLRRSFTTVQPFRGPGSSSEWIQEDVDVNNRISPAPNWGRVVFQAMTRNGRAMRVNAAGIVDVTDTAGTRETRTDPAGLPASLIVRWLRPGTWTPSR